MEKDNKKYYFSNKNIQESILFFLLSVFLISYALLNHYNSRKIQWQLSPYLFPLLIGILIVPISVTLFRKGIEQVKSGEKVKNLPIQWKGVLITISATILYYKFMVYVGFILSTTIFLFFMFSYFGERRLWFIILISLSCSLSIYGIFGILLKVILP